MSVMIADLTLRLFVIFLGPAFGSTSIWTGVIRLNKVEGADSEEEGCLAGVSDKLVG